MAQLICLESTEPDRPIALHVNSPGGSVTAGLAIYDTMIAIEPDVCTVATGLAASMGQFSSPAAHPASGWPCRTLPCR